MIKKDDLVENRLLISGAFILLDEDLPFALPSKTIPSNSYVCIYKNNTAMDNFEEAEGIERLLADIRTSGYSICEDYLAEVVAEASVFDYTKNDIYIKQQIPVRSAATGK